MLTDISNSTLEITTLGQRVAFPIGISPSALHKLANPDGEGATASAAAAMNTIMIVSSLASTSLEEVAESVWGTSSNLWMQLYIFVQPQSNRKHRSPCREERIQSTCADCGFKCYTNCILRCKRPSIDRQCSVRY